MKRMNKTKFAKAASAAFTGHRFYNFSQKELIKERLTKAILEAYKHGSTDSAVIEIFMSWNDADSRPSFQRSGG